MGGPRKVLGGFRILGAIVGLRALAALKLPGAVRTLGGLMCIHSFCVIRTPRSTTK